MTAAILASSLGKTFQPIFEAMAWLLAFFYGLIPNYAIAIALLTVAVMIVTAPLTIKSTRSMMAMQKLAPEMKKLQAKYKGDKQTLNEEMMKLYREHGVNPAGGCLPMLIQFPIFFILYAVIRGLTHTEPTGQYYYLPDGQLVKCVQGPCSAPQYISHNTKLYASLLQHHGAMPAFGLNLAAKVTGHHSFIEAVPYILLVLVAIGLQYLQMRQLNSRNPGMAQANPQAQMMQRYMPLLFGIIYINIAAGVNIYFIVSNLCRIGIQEAMFRSGILSKPDRASSTEEVLPGPGGARRSGGRRTLMERLADAQKRALEQQDLQRARQANAAGTQSQKPAPELESATGQSGDGSKDKNPGSSVVPKRPPSPNGGGKAGGSTAASNGAPKKSTNQSRAKKGRRGR